MDTYWLVWGQSCYYDRQLEFVYPYAMKDEAEAFAARLRRGGAEPLGEYDHPREVEYSVEERDQTVIG